MAIPHMFLQEFVSIYRSSDNACAVAASRYTRDRDIDGIFHVPNVANAKGRDLLS
jgi:hypothetical protein